MTDLSRANAAIFGRYEDLLEEHMTSGLVDPMADNARLSLANLLWMCRIGRVEASRMPEDKASRWLGFVQGCLAMRGLIDVDIEREETRPLFHAAHQAKFGKRPGTLSRDGT